MLLMQLAWRAFSRAWAKTGKRIAARMAMMAMTTSSSIRVKPDRRVRFMARSPEDDRGVVARTPFRLMFRRSVSRSSLARGCGSGRASDLGQQTGHPLDLRLDRSIPLDDAAALPALAVQHQHVEPIRLPP